MATEWTNRQRTGVVAVFDILTDTDGGDEIIVETGGESLAINGNFTTVLTNYDNILES